MRKFSKLVVLCLTLVVGLFLVACQEKIELSFENTSMTMTVGDTETLVPVASKEELVYEWTSDNTAVVTVDAGEVTAVSAGTAKVTVKVKDKDVTAEITITVNPVVITFSQDAMTIAIDQEVTLTPVVEPAQSMSFTWTTSAAGIATVTNGLVKGIAVGTATITASGKGGSDTITINVVLPDPTKVAITGALEAAKVGQTMQLGATVLPSKASQEVAWKSSDTALATVSPAGLVTFLGIGSVTITATSKVLDTQKATATIAIGAPDPLTIAVTGAEGKNSITISETLQMIASVSPDLANQGVTWSTSDATIATVDASGLLTPLKIGTVDVIATSSVLATVSGSVSITVVLPAPTSISVTGPESIIQVEETVQLTALIQPLQASQEVVYSSSNEAIATVSATGLVTGVAAGDAAIIVKSAVLDTVLMTYTVKVVEKITSPDYLHILIDANITADRYSTITVNSVDYIVGINAFTSLSLGMAKVIDGSTVLILEGTYEEAVSMNMSNVTILGPNALVNPVTDLEGRLPEATLTKKLTLGTVENVIIKGLALTAQGQIYSGSKLKNITVENIYAYDCTVDAAQGVIYFGITDDLLKNEDIKVLNSSLNDTKGLGYRGIRINNAFNLTIEGNYLYGFFDAIRLEGTGNSGWTAPGTGCGAAGVVLIKGNTFRMNGQYPIVIGRYSATNVDIINNDIGVDPDKTGVYGLTNMLNFVPDSGAPKTVVNIKYNNFLHNTAWHDVRFKTGTATAEQLEINVNFNKFNEGVCIDPVDGPCDYISNGGTTASANNIINGQFNYFAVEPVASEFLGLNDKGFAPYYTTLEDYNDALTALFVDPTITGKIAGDEVVVNGLTLVYGTRAFSTLVSALEVAEAKQTIVVLPGTYTEKITITQGVTLKTLNANINPTVDETAFLAASPTATISNEVWFINNANDVTIKGFTFTGNARIREYGTSGNQYRFLYENNYAFDTTETTILWKQTYYTAYGLNAEVNTTVPGFISLVPNGRWLMNFEFRNNKFSNVHDTNIFLLCVNGLTIEGNEFSDSDRDAIRLDYGSQGGVFNIKNNTFENILYNGVFVRSYSGSINAPDFVANIYYNTFKNVGGAGATEIPASTRLGAIATTGFGEKMDATFNIRYNAFENCTNYISLRANVTNVDTWATKNLVWSAYIEYNSFIDADGVTKYFQNLLNASDTTVTNVDEVYINYNFYGTDASTKATTTVDQFDHHKVASSNLVVYNTVAELEAGIVTSYIPTGVNVTGSAALKGGETATFKAAVLPNTAPQDVVWSTSDATIAIVDEAGLVTGLKPGAVKIKATAKDLETVFGEFDVTVAGVLPTNLLVDAGSTELADLTKITFSGKDFYVGVNAFDTFAEAMALADIGTTIYVNKGEYVATDAILINKDNISIIGPNANIDANTGTRVDEAVINFKITIATAVKNVVINGLSFNHNAATCIVTGEAAGLIDGFKFINNIVDGYSGDGSSGFIVFKQLTAETKVLNFTISNNKFFSFGADRPVRIAYVENLTFNNNVILDAPSDALRLNDNNGGVMGKLIIIGNSFTNVGQYGIFVGTTSCTLIQIQENKFINNGFTYGGGAVQLRKTLIDAAGTKVIITHNYFEDSENNDIRLDHLATATDNLTITVFGNTFKTIPAVNYYYNNNTTDVVVKTEFSGNTIFAADGTTLVDPATMSAKILNANITGSTPDLFFSEYGEGSSNNKWLEIYNPTSAPIDLGGYTVELYSNGATTVQNSLTFTAGTMLAAGDILLIVNASIVAEQKLPGYVESTVTYYNGDDVVVLKKGAAIIDMVGVIGTDPGSTWKIGEGATGEYTLVRKAPYAGFFNSPVPWTEQWDVYPQNTYTYMDAHVYTPA
ncbi:MAG: Ig-like domain-containing protein [Bacilli bacterium]